MSAEAVYEANQLHRRLNWGCGSWTEPGWINSDVNDAPGVDICCDIRDGLPLQDSSIDYVVSIHALPALPYDTVVPALRELRRVLRPGGVLRLGLPDLDRAIAAYRAGDESYFLIPNEHALSLGGKFILQILWYGYSRTVFTFDFAEELLSQAAFSSISRCGFHQTHSKFPGIIELDNRRDESFFVEAVKE